MKKMRQQGLGMIEVMIALTIGLVLLAGVASVFTSMRRTAHDAEALSKVQNQQRQAMYFMHLAVSGLGYIATPLTSSATSLFPVTGNFLAGQTLLGTGSNAGTDTLSVRFSASTNGGQQGCSSSLTAGHVYIDSYSISGGYLRCIETDSTAGTGPSSPILLVPGLAGMNILYGVDSDGSGSTTQYLTADQVTTNSLWGSVKTAQVSLLFTNALAGQAGQSATVTLTETIPYMANI